MIKTVEFYCGTKSFSKVADSLGMETFTVDIIKSFKPDLKKNMWDVVPEDVPYKPEHTWCSPDCSVWSCAAGSHHFTRQMEPKTLYAERAIGQLKRLRWLLNELGGYWYIENPRGRLRRMDFMDDLIRHTVTYCQYGDTRRKPTDIWTNNPHWQPRPMCELEDGCHPDKTMDKSTPRQRAVVPPELINEILCAGTSRALRT